MTPSPDPLPQSLPRPTRQRSPGAWLLPALSGLLLALSFPSFVHPDASPLAACLAWAALLPLLFALEGARPWKGLALGWAFGWVLLLAGTTWFPVQLDLGSATPLLWLGGAAWLALPYGLFGAAYAWLQVRQAPGQALWAPALWTLMEWSREHLSGGPPYLSLGSSQAPWAALLPLAAVLGVAGLHFAVFLGNLLLYRLASSQTPWRRYERLAATAALLSFLGVWALAPRPRLEGPAIKVALLQASLPYLRLGDPGVDRTLMDAYSALTVEAVYEGARLVVWPEGSFPEDPSQDGPKASALKDLARRHRVWLLLGSLSGGPGAAAGPMLNSATLIGPDGHRSVYSKRRVAPWVESPPPHLAWLHGRPAPKRAILGDGPSAEPMVAAGVTLSPQICYESLFGDAYRRDSAGLGLVLAQSAWAGASMAPAFHLQHSQLRAAENGRFMLHVAANGPSAIVGPDGRVLKALAWGKKGYLLGEVSGHCASPYHDGVGNFFIALCGALVAAGAFSWRRTNS